MKGHNSKPPNVITVKRDKSSTVNNRDTAIMNNVTEIWVITTQYSWRGMLDVFKCCDQIRGAQGTTYHYDENHGHARSETNAGETRRCEILCEKYLN